MGDDRFFQTFRSKTALTVGRARSGVGGKAPFIATVGGAGIRNSRNGFGLGLGKKQVSLDVGNIDGATIAIEFEADLRLGILGKVVEPNGFETMSRHVRNGRRKQVELEILGVVADVAIA